MKAPAVLVLSLLAATALAGCGGSDDENPTSTKTGTIDPGTLAEGKGAVQGILIDDAYRPIAEALVLLQPAGTTLETTGNGEFAFGDLDPGAYTLRVEAPGHEAASTTVHVEEGLITEVNVVARRIVSEGGSTIASEHSVFIPCNFLVAGVGGSYGCLDTSGDSYRPGITGINYTGESEATFLVTEMMVREAGHYILEVRHDDGTATGGELYGTAYTDGGEYAKVVMEVGNSTDGRAVWNNDKLLAALVFYGGENLPLGEHEVGGITLRPGWTGVSFADKAQVVQTLFLGEPSEDPSAFCAICP